jgi:hypothetical protein
LIMPFDRSSVHWKATKTLGFGRSSMKWMASCCPPQSTAALRNAQTCGVPRCTALATGKRAGALDWSSKVLRSRPLIELSRVALSRNPSGWNKECRFDVRVLQRFVNRISAALHDSSDHLVTLGAWSFCTSSSLRRGTRAANLWSDLCLAQAGNASNGVVDVWQIHS